MILSFIFPLTILIETNILKNINIKSHTLLKSSIITFTLGFIIKGILDIYGTTNSLLSLYLIFGIILFILSIFFYVKK